MNEDPHLEQEEGSDSENNLDMSEASNEAPVGPQYSNKPEESKDQHDDSTTG